MIHLRSWREHLLFFLILASFAHACGTSIAIAQTKEVSAIEGDLDVPSPTDFETRVNLVRKQLEATGERPTALADATLKRLRNYGAVTPSAVISVARAVGAYETKNQSEKGKAGTILTFPQTKLFIDTALPLVKYSPQIESELLKDKASLLEAENSSTEEIGALQEVVDTISPLGLDVDATRLEALTSLGGINYLLGHKILAKTAIFGVLSYQWYLVKDPDKQRHFKDLYITSGQNLIELSRGDLKALQNIHFAPSAMDDLKPQLDAAIKEAKDGNSPKPRIKD